MLSFKSINRWLALALCLVLCLPMVPGKAQAIDPMETERTCSLTLHFAPGGKVVQGTAFRVWRVASAGPFAQFTPVAPFDGYPVKMNGLTASGWADLATTLAGYVARDAIPPTATAQVTAKGAAAFSGLATGLYLVVGDPCQRDGVLYTPQAFLVSLPSRDANDQWVYDVQAKVKYEEELVPPGSHKVSVKVQKVWVDSPEDEAFRPQSITIQLLKDGAVYDTVVLTAGNNWRHTWTGLPPGHRWTIVEQTVVEGYQVAVSQNGSRSFVVTNTNKDIDIPPDGPPLEDDPTIDIPDVEIPGVEPPGSGRLPQTGMLWWPVPVLAVGGMACFLAGWVKERKGRDHEG